MRLVADSKGRLASRELFPPGTSFEAERTPGGRILLVELVPKPDRPPKVRLVRRGGGTFLVGDRPLTAEDVRTALEQFP